jgi:hypothetical protein
VESLGSVASWEYVDALHSAQENGIFTISNSQTLYRSDDNVRDRVADSMTRNLGNIDVLDVSILQTILAYTRNADPIANRLEHERSLKFLWESTQQKNKSKKLESFANSIENSGRELIPS